MSFIKTTWRRKILLLSRIELVLREMSPLLRGRNITMTWSVRYFSQWYCTQLRRNISLRRDITAVKGLMCHLHNVDTFSTRLVSLFKRFNLDFLPRFCLNSNYSVAESREHLKCCTAPLTVLNVTGGKFERTNGTFIHSPEWRAPLFFFRKKRAEGAMKGRAEEWIFVKCKRFCNVSFN